MSNRFNISQNTKKRIVNSILYFLIALYGTVLLFLAFLQAPFFQTYLAKEVSEKLSKETDYAIDIEKVKITWYDELQFNNLSITQDDSLVLSSQSLIVDFYLNWPWESKIVNLEAINLNSPVINLIKKDSLSEYNVINFYNQLSQVLGSDTSASESKPFKLTNIRIANGHLFHHNATLIPKDTIGFNLNHFSVSDFNLGLSKLDFIPDSVISIDLDSLSFKEDISNFALQQLGTQATIRSNKIELNNLELRTEASSVNRHIVLSFDNIDSLIQSPLKTRFAFNSDSTKIATNELGLFIPKIRDFNDVWEIKGNYSGTVSDFSSKNAEIKFGRSSRLIGSVEIQGLPNLEETFLDLDFISSTLEFSDLRTYLRGSKGFADYSVLQHLNFSADFYGYLEDFVAHGSFNSSLGYFETDLKFTSRDVKIPRYSGELTTENFNLGRFMGLPGVGKINMTGEVNGKGFKAGDVSMELNASVSSVVYNNYTFKNIETEAQLELGYFSGQIEMQDPNATLLSQGTIDFRNNKDLFDISASVRRADLKKLKLTDKAITVSSDLQLNFSSLDLDSIQGEGTLSNNRIIVEDDSLSFRDFRFESHIEDNRRDLRIQSEIVDAFLEGDFTFRSLAHDSKELKTELELIFRNDSLEIQRYFARKEPNKQDPYNIDFDILLKNTGTLSNYIFPDLKVSSNSTFTGSIESSDNIAIDLNADIENLSYKNIDFNQNRIDLLVEKHRDSTSIDGIAYVYSNKQNYKDSPLSRELFFQGVWDKKNIIFHQYLKQDGKNNDLELEGNIAFLNDDIRIKFNNSAINLGNEKWELNDKNELHLYKEFVAINNLGLSNRRQNIILDGDYSYDLKDTLNLKVRNFNLDNIKKIADVDLKGVVNGRVRVVTDFGDLNIVGNTRINDFSLSDFYVGNLDAKWKYDSDSKELLLDSKVFQNTRLITSISGRVRPSAPLAEQLDLKASFDGSSLNILQPLLKNNVSQMSGSMYGNINVLGSMKDPVFNGNINIDNGSLRINYLNVAYNFGGNILFKGDSIYTPGMVLTDDLWSTQLALSGGIKHQMFQNFESFLKIDLNKSFIFNNTQGTNDVFYGPAFATGTVYIEGPFTGLHIRSRELKSDRIETATTNISIPISSSGSTIEKSYIRFVNPYERKTKETTNSVNTDKSYVTLDLNLNLTPDATIEIILDEKDGEAIKANGHGLLNLKVDRNGEFNVFGDYFINTGGYSFTLAKLPVKKFTLTDKSSISFKGDPMYGDLDIEARYRQNASLLPLFSSELSDSTFEETSAIRGMAETDVILNLDGKLLAPEFSFDIQIIDYPNTTRVQNKIQEFKSIIRYNEQELNRQVFGLMLLRQFLPLQNTGVGADAVAGSAGNVSEVLTAQFGNLLSQFDENLQVDIDMTGFDESFDNSLRFSVSYSILDGRVRITRDGNIQSTNRTSNQELANILGEWTVEYLLTENGSLRIKGYNRTNQNVLYAGQGGNANGSNVYGISLTHTAEFDNLKELFGKKDEDEEPIDTTNTNDKKKEKETPKKSDEATLPENEENE